MTKKALAEKISDYSETKQEEYISRVLNIFDYLLEKNESVTDSRLEVIRELHDVFMILLSENRE
jgi:hypothetical protein